MNEPKHPLKAAELSRRDAGVPPTDKPFASYLQQRECNRCGEITTQTRHGFTVTGGLWKGHVCECRGWECRGCGAILERAHECCR
jgi:hypothetical protein